MHVLLLILTLSSQLQLSEYNVTYIDCYDGDTCYFDIHLGFNVVLSRQSIRLCDIDTPEIRGPDKQNALKAKRIINNILSNAKMITILVPQKTKCIKFGHCDKRTFNRWLGYIIADNENVNQKLLNIGVAKEYNEKCPLKLKSMVKNK